VELSGGEAARLVVVGTATKSPKEAEATYRKALGEIGIHDLTFLALDTRQGANETATLDAMRDATGVFFTRGDQLRIAQVSAVRVDRPSSRTSSRLRRSSRR
jgi:cyanophycinase